MPDVGEWRTTIERVRQSRKAHSAFGADEHHFKLQPVLSEREVRAFETGHGCRLPDDYRAFLTTVGNGGAGPAYGVFPLGCMDQGAKGTAPWGTLVGDISVAFPHGGAWNDLTGQPPDYDGAPDTPEEDEHWRRVEAFEKRYFDTQHVTGAIPICHKGCALRVWLVVTGPERGHVWDDSRSDFRGLSPIACADHARMTFQDWYQAWLDHEVMPLLSERLAPL